MTKQTQQTIFKILAVFSLFLAGVTLLAFGTHGEEPTWIQYFEPLAGANSPNFTDTLNRPAQTIWNNFLIEHTTDGYHNYSALAALLPVDMPSKLDVSIFETEHNPDGSHSFSFPSTTDDIAEGSNLYYTDSRVSANTTVSSNTTHRTTTIGNPHNLDAADVGCVSSSTFAVGHYGDGAHNFSIPDLSEYAVSGSGTGSSARAEFTPATHHLGDFSIWGIVTVERLDTAESFYGRIETEYSETVLQFKKTALNELSLDMGSASYISTLVLDVSHLNRPIEVGVVYNSVAQEIFFFLEGHSDAAQAVTPVYPSMNLMESHRIGEGLQGDVLTLSMSRQVMFAPSSWHTPLYEGFSQCIGCLIHYDMDNQGGSTLTDRMGTYDLLVYGLWTEYAGGY